MDFLTKALLARGFIATKKLNQLARESFVIRAVALRGLAIGVHFGGEVAQGGLSLRAMLAVLVPIVSPQGEKDAYGNEDDFDQQVEEGSSMFVAVQAHGREYRSMEVGAREERDRGCSCLLSVNWDGN